MACGTEDINIGIGELQVRDKTSAKLQEASTKGTIITPGSAEA